MKKAQVGMIETLMVLIVIVVILIIGVVFYFQFSSKHLEETAEDIRGQTIDVLLATTMQMPEIECSRMGDDVSKSCVDVFKLASMISHAEENKEHYFNIFGFTTIKFEQIYPETNGEECTASNFPSADCPAYPSSSKDCCGIWTIYSNPKGERKYFKSMPVSLYYPSHHPMFAFGKLVIEVY